MTIRAWYRRIYSDNLRSNESRRSRKHAVQTIELLETRALLTVTFGRQLLAISGVNGDNHIDFPLGNHPFAQAFGDFNNDGNLDIAIGSADLTSVSILSGDGQGNFPARVEVPIGEGIGIDALAVADFNGDGKLDLIVAGSLFGVDGKVKVLPGNGNNTFQNGVILSNTTVAHGALTTGDNKVDLIMADLDGAAVRVFAGHGNGGGSSAISFAVGQNPGSVALGDFNLDGKVDLVSANEGSDTVSLLQGNGDATFQLHVDLAMIPGMSWTAFQDTMRRP